MPRKRKVKTTFCPPAIADGIKTTAEVTPIRRRAHQKPKKRKKTIDQKAGSKRRRRPRKRLVNFSEEQIQTMYEPKVSQLPIQRWTTFSRKAMNDEKDRQAKRKNRAKLLKKKLRVAVRKLTRAEEKRRKTHPRRRLRDVLKDGGQKGEEKQLPRTPKTAKGKRSGKARKTERKPKGYEGKEVQSPS